MTPTTRVLLVALAAGLLGLGASLLTTGPGPLLRTELGQRALQQVLEARAPAPPAGTRPVRVGERLPAITLPTLDGTPATLAGLQAGRPVLVNFWASWCPPCIEEMPELERFARSQGSQGTQVVGIALDEAEPVRAFLARVPVSYPLLLDRPGPADSSVLLGNPAGVLPYSVLVSADGRLLKRRVGPFDPGEVDGWADVPASEGARASTQTSD